MPKEKLRLAEYEALENFKKHYKFFTIEDMISMYVNFSDFWHFEYLPLKLMGIEKFTRCLKNGYELGETSVDYGRVSGAPFFLLTDENVKELAKKLHDRLENHQPGFMYITIKNVEDELREIFELKEEN